MIITKATPLFGTSYDVGYIGFTRTFDRIGDAIAYGERWEQDKSVPSVNHVLIVTGDGTCVQAHIQDGVQKGLLSDYLTDSKSKVYFREPLGWSLDLGKRIAQAGITKIGCKYAKDLIVEQVIADSLLGHLVNEIFQDWPHKILSSRLTNPLEFICSQLGAYALACQPEFKGCPLFDNDLASIDPQLLFENGPYFGGITDCSITT